MSQGTQYHAAIVNVAQVGAQQIQDASGERMVFFVVTARLGEIPIRLEFNSNIDHENLVKSLRQIADKLEKEIPK